jgi:hypothetical protein
MEGPIEPSSESRAEPIEAQPQQHLDAVHPARPCKITFDGANAPEPTRTEVRAWLDKLGALTAPMTGGHVAIESIDEIRKDRLYRVCIELVMPAGLVTVGIDHPSNAVHEDIYVAIRNAFRGARRQLEAYFQEQAVAAAIAPTRPTTGEFSVVSPG